jgi:hypothetical protein
MNVSSESLPAEDLFNSQSIAAPRNHTEASRAA